MMITRWTSAGMLLMTFVLLGCGESVPPPPKLDLVPVSGTVKFGGQPTEGIRVTFTPTGNTPGGGSTAMTGKDGKYVLAHSTDQKPGVPAGTYTVKFLKSAGISPNSSIKHEDLAENLIPPSWRGAPDNNGMVDPHNMATVPAGGGTLDFDIPAQ